MNRHSFSLLAVLAAVVLVPARAQYLSPVQLDDMVSRVALYPDPLLAQILTASTYYDQIPEAAAWAYRHRHLYGEQLAREIEADNLPWDPSVLALLPFPSVLEIMDRDLTWTRALGDAVLDSRGEVMDAIQRMRHRAHQHGYLRDCPQYRVVYGGPIIEIVPVDAGILYVPVYDHRWVYGPPRPGITIGISFGPRIIIGTHFHGVGWRSPRFDWRARAVFIDEHRWDRGRANRTVYVHTYREPLRGRPPGPAMERRGPAAPRAVSPARVERNAPQRRDVREAPPSRPERVERSVPERRATPEARSSNSGRSEREASKTREASASESKGESRGDRKGAASRESRQGKRQ